MNIESLHSPPIFWTSFNCPTCQGPVKQVPQGPRINQINSIGAKLTHTKPPTHFKHGWTITPKRLDLLVELAEAGGSLDAQGFVTSEI